MNKILILASLLLVILLLTCTTTPQVKLLNEPKREPNYGPRYHPVYIDDPNSYLNEQIYYSEWNQDLTSSL